MTSEETFFLLSNEAKCAALCGRAKAGAKVHFFYQEKKLLGAITSGSLVNAYFEKSTERTKIVSTTKSTNTDAICKSACHFNGAYCEKSTTSKLERRCGGGAIKQGDAGENT